MKRFVIPAVILIAACLAPGSSAVAAQGRALSGTVITGSAEWPDYGPLCEKAPDCQAWLQSDCSRVLAGREPALMTSIVDVRALGPGVTRASLGYGSMVPSGLPWVVPQWTGVVVEFWDQGCREISDTYWSASLCVAAERDDCRSPILAIPTAARWITVGGLYAGNPPTWWTLTPLPPERLSQGNRPR